MRTSRLKDILADHEEALLSEWMEIQKEALAGVRDRLSGAELRTNSHDFVLALQQSVASGVQEDVTGPSWADLREMLGNLSRQRALQGFSPSETAIFVFSFKEAYFRVLRQHFGNQPDVVAEEIWVVGSLMDRLGLFTTEVYQKSREGVIIRQQQELLELSSPVVELWPGILALPLIGTLDSSRTQVVMQNLLEAIVSKNADMSIIDITGVPTVDTLVAQHLLKTVSAARLMGAECIISGIRPQIAQTIIHLGVDLGDVITKASLADALRIALKKKNLTVSKV